MSWCQCIPLTAQYIFDPFFEGHDIVMIVLPSGVLSELETRDSAFHEFPRGVSRCDDGLDMLRIGRVLGVRSRVHGMRSCNNNVVFFRC